MMRRFRGTAALVLVATVAHAQFGTSDWTTSGFDAQRSNWVRADPRISSESMRKPGFELLWKFNASGAEGHGLFMPPVLLDFYISYRGFRTLGFFGNTADSVIAIDTDLGRLEWRKDFKAAGTAAPENSGQCPGGMTAGVARPTNIAYPSATFARGFGRGSPAKSGVGEPHEGAVTLKAAPRTPPPTAAPKGSAVATTRRPTPDPLEAFRPRIQWVYALSGDGKLHAMYVSNGDEPKPAISFLAPNANAQGLIVFDNTAYVSTSNSCGGVANGVWALNLESQKVANWESKGTRVAGPAVGSDGTLYVASGAELVALEEKTLKPKSTYKISGQEFTSSPVVFEFREKNLVVAMSNDGRLHLLNTADLNAPVATTPTFAGGHSMEAITTWQDIAGTRWILVPTAKTIATWKVVEQNGATTFQRGWTSSEMTSPITPIVVNGVVFAASSGGESTPAVLYALDGLDGKELWSSGKIMTAPLRRGGLAAGGSRIYVATQDGIQYSFGFPIEH